MNAAPRSLRMRVLACVAALATALAPALPVQAEATGPGNQRFVYRADGKRLSDVLNDFAAAQGTPVVVDQRVEGVVSGNFDTTARQFLDGISRAYALIWYFDGTAYYFYPASAIQSRIFRLKGYQRKQVVQLLESLRVANDRYPIRWDSTNSTLLVYGPPRHVELVGLAVESLDVGAIEQNRRVARVFPLVNASAGDRQMGSVNVAGVVSTLRSVFNGATRQNPGSVLAQAQKSAARSLAPTTKAMQAMYGGMQQQGGFLSGIQGGAAPPVPNDSAGAAPSPRSVRSPLDDDTDEDAPVFEADESSNAVIVYAKARRMEEIGALIRTLDVKPVLVELEATVIDVSADSLSMLGVDWSAQGAHGQVSVAGPQGGDVSTGSGASAQPFTVTTLLSDAGRALMARVQALAGDGRARVVSKPRVLGEANRPAVMSDKRIASVRVAGNLDVNLFQVEAGTTLQVTPQVSPGASGAPSTIKLSIFIQDGSFQSTKVDQVPVVKRTEIRTEARVREGQSLLIGGITVDAESSGVTGVPLLKDIPVIGAVFRQTTQHTTRSERMFLLTPHIVTPAPAVQAAAAAPVAAAPAVPAAPSREALRPLLDRLGDADSYSFRGASAKADAGVRKP